MVCDWVWYNFGCKGRCTERRWVGMEKSHSFVDVQCFYLKNTLQPTHICFHFVFVSAVARV